LKRKYLIITGLTIFLSMIGASAYSAIYSYRDEHGRLFLTDSPPNSKYQIVVTTKKECEAPDSPEVSLAQKEAFLLPNDDAFSEHINEAARLHSLDPFLIKSIIKAESDFDPKVVSSKGAKGLMQLMPATAQSVGCHNPFDAKENIMGGSSYFKKMLTRFKGNRELALAAYNAGPGNVDKYKGVPPFRETQNYIRKVNHYHQLYLSESSSSPKKTTAVASLPVVNRELTLKLKKAYKLFAEDRVEEAISAYREIVMLHPKNTQALYNLACILDMERFYDEALAIYQSALRQDPYLDKALYNMAVIYEKIGMHKSAINTWKSYLQIAKDEEKTIRAEKFIKELTEYAALKKSR
jgi:hypothetical protein